jgi:hypothetical protein
MDFYLGIIVVGNNKAINMKANILETYILLDSTVIIRITF